MGKILKIHEKWSKKCPKVVQMGPNEAKLRPNWGQMGPNEAKLRPNGSKWGQMGPNEGPQWSHSGIQWEWDTRTHTTGTHPGTHHVPRTHYPGYHHPMHRVPMAHACRARQCTRVRQASFGYSQKCIIPTCLKLPLFDWSKPTCQKWHFSEKSLPNPHSYLRKCHFCRFC